MSQSDTTHETDAEESVQQPPVANPSPLFNPRSSIFGSPPQSLRNNREKRMPPPPTPPHLSEFISYVNGSGDVLSNKDDNNDNNKLPNLDKIHYALKKKLDKKKKNSATNADTTNINPTHPFNSNSSTSTWSLGSGTSMTPTTLDLEVLVTRKDINESLLQFKELNNVCEELSNNLKGVSESFGKFGSIMEKISRSKGSGEYCNMIGTFSNYQYLISNQHRYLSEIIEREFRDHIGTIESEYVKNNSERESIFQAEYGQLVKELKRTEKMESKLRRGKTRNLVLYKNNLNNLSNKLDDIDNLRHDYYVDMFKMLENAHGDILQHSKCIINQEALIFDKLAEKTKPGNGLDALFLDHDVSGHSEEEDEYSTDVEDGDETIDAENTENEQEAAAVDDPVLQDKLYMEKAVADLRLDSS